MSSKSGKMGNRHMLAYKNEILKELFGEQEFVLMLDGWKGQISDDLFCDLHKMKKLIIPDKGTDKCQPLDTPKGFMQWKNVTKKCYLRVIIDDLKIDYLIYVKEKLLLNCNLLFLTNFALQNLFQC